MEEKTYPRIFLWASHRSLSTAFFRAMECRSDIKGLVEPYSLAYFFGQDRKTQYFDGKNVHPDTSMKEQLVKVKGIATEHSPVFIKDLAAFIVCRENPLNYIPNDFINTFLFRDPRKSYRSCYRMLTRVSDVPMEQIDIPVVRNMIHDKEHGRNAVCFYMHPILTILFQWKSYHNTFPLSLENKHVVEKFFEENTLFSVKHVWKLYKLIKSQQPDKELFVIDSDDFLEYPEEILRAYSQHVGLEYLDSMLDWSKKSDTLIADSVWSSWFGDALNSNTIDKNVTDTNAKLMDDQLPECIEKAIQTDMIYYRKLLTVKFKL